jgi:hypothetical protein
LFVDPRVSLGAARAFISRTPRQLSPLSALPIARGDDHATGARAIARVEQIIGRLEVTGNQDSRNNGDYAFTAFIHELKDSSIIRFLFATKIRLA